MSIMKSDVNSCLKLKTYPACEILLTFKMKVDSSTKFGGLVASAR